MLFLIRRRRFQFLLTLICLFIFYQSIRSKFTIQPSSWSFLEVNECPHCFGIRLCPLFFNERFQFERFHRYSVFHQQYLNVKNIYEAVDNQQRKFILKKLAHHSEWIEFDRAQKNTTKQQITHSLLSCHHNSTLIDEFQSE